MNKYEKLQKALNQTMTVQTWESKCLIYHH